MPTRFSSIENAAFEHATKLNRTQAFLVAVDYESDHTAKYQCRVLPDLLSLEDVNQCPWYPSIDPSVKLDVKEGELLWVYVADDLGVGYVEGRANTLADQPDILRQRWESLSTTIQDLPDGPNHDVNVDKEIDYENAYYTQLFGNLFMFFDRERRMVGLVDSETDAGVIFQRDNLYLKSGTATIHADVNIDGSVAIGAGDSPAVRYNELIDILQEVESHIHVAPTGPTQIAIATDFTPLSAKLIQLKNTLASVALEIE